MLILEGLICLAVGIFFVYQMPQFSPPRGLQDVSEKNANRRLLSDSFDEFVDPEVKEVLEVSSTLLIRPHREHGHIANPSTSPGPSHICTQDDK